MKLNELMDKHIAIEASSLTKKFEDLTAVDNISFSIQKGEIVGLLGPNGAGKTTTIRMITGVHPLNENAKLKIFDNEITEFRKSYKNYFGIVPEISNAYRDYTVWQNIKFNGKIYGMRKNEIQSRGHRLISTFQLQDKINVATKALSKGLKQRLNFCMALIHNPPILIFDEPTSGLDPISINILRKQMIALKNEGKTIFITTHDMLEAQRICDRILIMNKGRIIADEDPDVLRENFKPTLNIMFSFQSELSERQFNDLKKQFGVRKTENTTFIFSSEDPLRDLSLLQKFKKEENLQIEKLKFEETSLEEVFIDLIKGDLLK